MTASTPYIGPVNARSAPAAASRRPQKKRTKKQAGSFPLSGPPPPIGNPILHPLRRGGLTAGPRPVRPSASAGPCCPAMPPPVSSALPLGREAGKFPNGIEFAAPPNRGFPAFLRGSGDSRAFKTHKKRLWVDRSVCFSLPGPSGTLVLPPFAEKSSEEGEGKEGREPAPADKARRRDAPYGPGAAPSRLATRMPVTINAVPARW